MNAATRRRWTLAVLVTAIIASLLLFGLHLNRPRAQTPPSTAPAVARVVAAAPGWVDVQGGTRLLSAKADGIVVRIAAISEAPVRAGTVLLRLDDRELQLEQQAHALEMQRQQHSEQALAEQLQRAREEVLRLQALVRIQAEPADVLRQSQAQVRDLERALQAARLDVATGKIRQRLLALQGRHRLVLAPSRGRVLRLDVHEGESVSRGAPVAWFAPDAPMIVRAELDERLFGKMRIGMSAEVESESGDGHVFQAKLLSIARNVGPVRALPERRAAAKDDRVVECVLELRASDLLIGQRVIVRFAELP